MDSSFTTADKISMLLLFATTLGALGVFWQVRVAAKTQRAMFLKDLYMRLRDDKDISEAFYYIEYGKFEYTASFHGSILEPKIDRLLTIFDLVCELNAQGAITAREMHFFEYQFRRVFQNAEIQNYLTFLGQFYERIGVAKRPFAAFQVYASSMKN